MLRPQRPRRPLPDTPRRRVLRRPRRGTARRRGPRHGVARGRASKDATASDSARKPAGKAAADSKVVGYFTDWGIYQRNYHVKNIETSGSAAKLTHINYAFGNVTGGKCAIGDAYADYEKAYTAEQSRRRRRRHLGPAAARQLQPAAQAEEEAPGPQGPLVLRRLDLVRRLRRGRQEPGRLRPVLLRPGRELPLGGRLRRHRHRLGVPQRLRSDLRHQRPGRLTRS